MINTHTSAWLNKKLYEAGFKGETDKISVLSKSAYDDEAPTSYITDSSYAERITHYKTPRTSNEFKCGKLKLIARCDYELICEIYPAYDILNDLCVKHAFEFFRDKPNGIILSQVFRMMFEGKKEEAENFLWEYCILNKT